MNTQRSCRSMENSSIHTLFLQWHIRDYICGNFPLSLCRAYLVFCHNRTYQSSLLSLTDCWTKKRSDHSWMKQSVSESNTRRTTPTTSTNPGGGNQWRVREGDRPTTVTCLPVWCLRVSTIAPPRPSVTANPATAPIITITARPLHPLRPINRISSRWNVCRTAYVIVSIRQVCYSHAHMMFITTWNIFLHKRNILDKVSNVCFFPSKFHS